MFITYKLTMWMIIVTNQKRKNVSLNGNIFVCFETENDTDCFVKNSIFFGFAFANYRFCIYYFPFFRISFLVFFWNVDYLL